MEERLRTKQLESLAKSSQGRALKEWLEIEINRLENVSLIPDEGFNEKARAHKSAALLLRKLFRYLETIGKKTTEREKNQYI